MISDEQLERSKQISKQLEKHQKQVTITQYLIKQLFDNIKLVGETKQVTEQYSNKQEKLATFDDMKGVL